MWKYEHRVIMEQSLGRKLARGEVVHHKDGNTLNNDPSNLKLYYNPDHSYYHYHNGAEDEMR